MHQMLPNAAPYGMGMDTSAHHAITKIRQLMAPLKDLTGQGNPLEVLRGAVTQVTHQDVQPAGASETRIQIHQRMHKRLELLGKDIDDIVRLKQDVETALSAILTSVRHLQNEQSGMASGYPACSSAPMGMGAGAFPQQQARGDGHHQQMPFGAFAQGPGVHDHPQAPIQPLVPQGFVNGRVGDPTAHMRDMRGMPQPGMQQPGMQQMQATVPPGYAPGQSFEIMTPSGMMQLVVPEGHMPGQTFIFMVPAMPAQPVQAMAVPAQPMYADGSYGKPVPATAVVAPAPPAVIVQSGPAVVVSTDPLGPPIGAPPGGRWMDEQFTGAVTCIFALIIFFFFWPATAAPFCCPCDQRTVYVAPNGQKYTRSGAYVPPNDCCGHPCGGPSY